MIRITLNASNEAVARTRNNASTSHQTVLKSNVLEAHRRLGIIIIYARSKVNTGPLSLNRRQGLSAAQLVGAGNAPAWANSPLRISHVGDSERGEQTQEVRFKLISYE